MSSFLPIDSPPPHFPLLAKIIKIRFIQMVPMISILIFTFVMDVIESYELNSSGRYTLYVHFCVLLVVMYIISSALKSIAYLAIAHTLLC